MTHDARREVPADAASAWWCRFRLTTNYGWTDPQIISGTDVETAGLVGLRRPRNDATTWTVSIFHPLRAGPTPLTRLVLNPFSFNASGFVSSQLDAVAAATSRRPTGRGR